MQATQEHIDRSRDMEERSWWDFWNASYRSEDDRDATSTRLFTTVAEVLQAVSQGRALRVLEVACGAGALSRKLSFATYHGLDISPAAITIAQSKAQPLRAGQLSVPTYEAVDFHTWQIPAEPFDVLVCVDALHSFRGPRLAMRKMAASLREGGRLIVATINPVVYNRIRRVDGVKLENGPVSHWHSKREFHDLVKQAALIMEDSYTIMPLGNKGILRIINSGRLNNALGPQGAAAFDRLKERVGLGQYRVVIAKKS